MKKLFIVFTISLSSVTIELAFSNKVIRLEFDLLPLKYSFPVFQKVWLSIALLTLKAS